MRQVKALCGGDMTKYDNKHKCTQCGGENEIKTTDSLDGYIHACKTECKECGHPGYWETGFFYDPDWN